MPYPASSLDRRILSRFHRWRNSRAVAMSPFLLDPLANNPCRSENQHAGHDRFRITVDCVYDFHKLLAGAVVLVAVNRAAHAVRKPIFFASLRIAHHSAMFATRFWSLRFQDSQAFFKRRQTFEDFIHFSPACNPRSIGSWNSPAAPTCSRGRFGRGATPGVCSSHRPPDEFDSIQIAARWRGSSSTPLSESDIRWRQWKPLAIHRKGRAGEMEVRCS